MRSPLTTMGGGGFANGWANFGAPHPPVAWWKDESGAVHLRGVITSGTGDGAHRAFTLPAGYRPLYKERFTMAAYPGFITGQTSSLLIPSVPLTATIVGGSIGAAGSDSAGDTVSTLGPLGGDMTINGNTTASTKSVVLDAFLTWVDVDANGDVLPWQTCATGGYFVSLCGIDFLAEQ